MGEYSEELSTIEQVLSTIKRNIGNEFLFDGKTNVPPEISIEVDQQNGFEQDNIHDNGILVLNFLMSKSHFFLIKKLRN